MSFGSVSYTRERFLGNCTDKTRKLLLKAWKEGDQLASAKVPRDALPAVLILACYAMRVDMELVDDYDELVARTRAEMDAGGLHHPDLYLASCILILAERGDVPTIGAFTQIGVDRLLNEFLGVDDE